MLIHNLQSPRNHSLSRLFLNYKRTLQPSGLHRPRGVAPSEFPPLRNILSCCLPSASGPYLSHNVSAPPVRPDTCHRLGGPLPHQQADRSQAILSAAPQRLSPCGSNPHGLIRYYPLFLGAIPVQKVYHPRVTHQSATLGRPEAACRPTCMLKTRRQRLF